MRQVIEVAIPPSFDATVGQALQHLLLRTGYRLCDAPEAAPLFALPLPASHLHLGPLPLRDALVVLAGPAWQLAVDDVARTVCFGRDARARPADGATAFGARGSVAPSPEPAKRVRP